MGTKEKKDKIQEGVEKYLEIRTLYDKTDFDVNSDFAKKFDAFCRVRRDEEWRKKFFQLFAAMKKDKEKASFNTILSNLYYLTGYVEASFSSKMLHTINPEMPIWDSIVLSKLKKRLNITVLPYQKDRPFEDTLNNRVEVYNEIIEWYKTEDATAYESQFDTDYPEYKDKLGRTKKIDFMLWGTEEKLDKVFDKYEAVYKDILSSFYPSLGNTGFQERNLTVNFSKAYEKAFPNDTVFSWFELQFGKENSNHFDCLIVNDSQKEMLFIESKRFSDTTKKVKSVLNDIKRVYDFVHTDLGKDDRFKEFYDKGYKAYGMILADIWQENSRKKQLYDLFKTKSFFKEIPSFLKTDCEEYKAILNLLPNDDSEEYFVTDLLYQYQKEDGSNGFKVIESQDKEAFYSLLSFLWEI